MISVQEEEGMGMGHFDVAVFLDVRLTQVCEIRVTEVRLRCVCISAQNRNDQSTVLLISWLGDDDEKGENIWRRRLLHHAIHSTVVCLRFSSSMPVVCACASGALR